MSTVYTFSISGDFPNHKVNAGSLHEEIGASDIVTALDGITTQGDDCLITFKATLSVADEAELNALVAAHQGLPPKTTPVAADGSPIVSISGQQADSALPVAIAGRRGNEWIIASHNYCDPTTWYSTSVRVAVETLVDSGDGLTFTSQHANWIDLTHGKVLWEDDLAGPFKPVVKVYGVTKVEDPMYGTQADYSINYTLGRVTFHESQAGKTITAAYSYMVDSQWIVEPRSGWMVDIEEAEIQFSADLTYNDCIRLAVWGYVIAFAPQLAQSNGGPLPDLERIELRARRYLRHDQIIDEAKGTYPVVGAVGGIGGHAHPRYGYPMIYKTVTTLLSSAGMQLRGSLENNIAFGGERATVTFYGVDSQE